VAVASRAVSDHAGEILRAVFSENAAVKKSKAARQVTGRGQFQSFQSFHRFATFQPLKI